MRDTHRIMKTAANRMAGLPRWRWKTATSKKNPYYRWARNIEHGLPNEAANEAIQSVRESFESWRNRGYDGERPQFKKGNRVVFRDRHPKYKVINDRYYVSLPFAAGRGQRELLPIKDGNYSRAFIDDFLSGDLKQGRCELIRQNGRYELHQTHSTEIDVEKDPDVLVGVDVGLINIAVAAAVDADTGEKLGAKLWSGAEAADRRKRFYEAKRRSQSEKKYERLDDRERRFVENQCHLVSKEVVEWGKQFGSIKIVMEDLTDIRDTFIKRKREYAKPLRRSLHSWPFRKTQDMIDYKALNEGFDTDYINPQNTSTTCNECGYYEEDNRNGVWFICLNPECSYMVNADVNAAYNHVKVDQGNFPR